MSYGVHAEVCAESFLFFGKALLEMSKIESAVLGNAFEGFEHEIVKEFSLVESQEDMSRAEMEEIEEAIEEY